ncbi:MAG: peptidoglycan-binding protein [Clostridia bacterium]|nr:peptidoglycan-binding protein [Clostridia bacterium]
MKRLICLMLCIALMLSSVVFAETYTGKDAVYQPLKYETKDSDEVRAMQERLKELGFFDAGITGGYYGVTADAVREFQKAAGLEVNRKLASGEMLALLFSDDAPLADGAQPTAAPVPTATPDVVLSYGLKNNEKVRQVQKRLAELGYFASNVTGNYFDVTRVAVEAFQAKAGLEVNGKVIDSKTMELLFSESAPAANWSPSATATPMPTATPRPVYTTVPNATPRPALFYGSSSGDAVIEMQLRLKELGFLTSTATGGYWSITEKAVAAFQLAAGLPVNGRVADTYTLEKLFSNDAPVGPDWKEEVNQLMPLYFGVSGDLQVRDMQDRLRELGYFSDVSTGSYYLKTSDAVAEFQKAVGLPVRGYIASVEMLEILYSENAPKYDPDRPEATLRPTETPEPTATSAPTVTPEPTATPVPTVEPTKAPYRELKYGMSADDEVYAMQVRLRELGYLNTSPTGGYWSMTVTAVKAFLKDQGLSGDGKTMTAQMLALLYQEKQPEEDEPGEDETVLYETLTYGMEKNAGVKAMQARLRALGYFNESATGNYYSLTARAVEAFQLAAGLPINGDAVSPEMQALLFSADAPTADGGVLPPEDGGSSGGSDLPALDTSYQALKYGMENSDLVRMMQKKLKERGFFSGSPTGGYYDATRKAVASFQTYAKLPVNGKEASSLTLAYLYYTGDLDALIANGGVVPPSNGTPEYDPDKYQNAQTDTLLSKGDKGEQVNLLIMRLTELGYLTDTKPTYYDSDVHDAVKWFQNTNLLDSDGIAGPKTLKTLYSKSAMSADEGMKDNVSSGEPEEVEGEKIEVSIGTVLNIDWFSSEGDRYYNRRTGAMCDGAVVIITDVDSGLSFRAKRGGGYNHADMEPLTAYDTWVMYQIYDEEWTWKRHAVYITLENGISLAASINGMPHGSGSISNNNFDGHFCAHFLNSRTHGTDRVDPDHQAAVKKAASR